MEQQSNVTATGKHIGECAVTTTQNGIVIEAELAGQLLRLLNDWFGYHTGTVDCDQMSQTLNDAQHTLIDLDREFRMVSRQKNNMPESQENDAGIKS